MGNNGFFRNDDFDNWQPKAKRPSISDRHLFQRQTAEYKTMYTKIQNNSLHLTREPSKWNRLNQIQALCDIISNNMKQCIDNKERDKIITSLSIWNWRYIGASNDGKYICRIADSLQNNQYIERLHFVNCHINNAQKIRILIEALKRRNVLLSDLDLSGNDFGNNKQCIQLIAKFLSSYHCTSKLRKITLRATKLQNEYFSDDFIQILSKSKTLLQNLELFSLTHNKLKQQSLQSLTKWLLSSNERNLDKMNAKNADDLIDYLSYFRKCKAMNLQLTTNPIKDCGVKQLCPLMESDFVFSEFHLRSCSLTSEGIMCLLDSYLQRQRRVIEQHCELIYVLLKDYSMYIPKNLCGLIVDFMADFTMDRRLNIHFGLSRCSLVNDDGFNKIMTKYVVENKLIAKCLDVRMIDAQITQVDMMQVYDLAHYLKCCGNGRLGRFIFCVSPSLFGLIKKVMAIVTSDGGIEGILNYIEKETCCDNVHLSDWHLFRAKLLKKRGMANCRRDDDDCLFQLNTNSDYAEIDVTHSSYIDLEGEKKPFCV